MATVYDIKQELLQRLGVRMHCEALEQTRYLDDPHPHDAFRALWSQLNRLGGERGMDKAETSNIDQAAELTNQETRRFRTLIAAIGSVFDNLPAA